MDSLEASHSGLVRSLGKRICRKASEVRILPPPQGFERGMGRKGSNRVPSVSESGVPQSGTRILRTEGF